MIKNSDLRKNARAQLGNSIFAKTWLMLLVANFIYTAISSAAAIVAILIVGSLTYGLARICVNLVRGKNEVDLNDLFCGFTENFSGSLLVHLMVSLFTFLWSLLLIVPGIIKAYSYAMAPYILQDDHTKNWKQCIDESKEMMKGYRWQLFCLDMSFIGWYLLGMLCLGVGVLFVTPYQMTARANFYVSLKEIHEQNNDTGTGYEKIEFVDPFA